MESDKKKQSTSQRILFCTDFSKNADFAFSFAVDATLRCSGSELFLIHVIPESESQFWKTYIYEVEDVDAKAQHDIDRKIEQAYLSNLPDDLNIQIEIRIGKSDQEILRFARANKIDLIVVGRQGHSSFQKTLFGNVSEKIVRKADCPVLVIPLGYQKDPTKKSNKPHRN